jgi:hypothetical protein
LGPNAAACLREVGAELDSGPGASGDDAFHALGVLVIIGRKRKSARDGVAAFA